MLVRSLAFHRIDVNRQRPRFLLALFKLAISTASSNALQDWEAVDRCIWYHGHKEFALTNDSVVFCQHLSCQMRLVMKRATHMPTPQNPTTTPICIKSPRRTSEPPCSKRPRAHLALKPTTKLPNVGSISHTLNPSRTPAPSKYPPTNPQLHPTLIPIVIAFATTNPLAPNPHTPNNNQLLPANATNCPTFQELCARIWAGVATALTKASRIPLMARRGMR